MMNYFYTNTGFQGAGFPGWMYQMMGGFNNGVGAPGFAFALLPFLSVFLLWSFFWKGLALWHAGRRGDVVWFIVMLFVNLLGLLEIIYLFGIAKLKVSELFSRGHHHNA